MEAEIRWDERVLGDFQASQLTSFVSCEKNPTPGVHNNLQGAGLDGGDLSYVIVVVKIHNLQQQKSVWDKKTNRNCEIVSVWMWTD